MITQSHVACFKSVKDAASTPKYTQPGDSRMRLAEHFSRFSETERRTFCMAGPPVTEPNPGHREISYFFVNDLYIKERKSPDPLNNLLFFLPKDGLASKVNQVRVQGTPVAS
ncbi:MAG: hypothetical protein KJN79_09720 [Gammaproteobacteria bacterium]|jgi:hypothetical protein|nr:hypothetical protein [Gammaproteobacteria bacterium]